MLVVYYLDIVCVKNIYSFDSSNVFRNTRDLLKIGEYHSDIPQGHIQSRDAFRSIAWVRKYHPILVTD